MILHTSLGWISTIGCHLRVVLDDRLLSIMMKFDTSAQDMHKKEPSTSYYYHRMMRRRRYLLSSSIVILFFTTTNIIVHATTNFCGVDCKFFECNMTLD